MELVSWGNLVHGRVTNLTKALNLLALARMNEGESGPKPVAGSMEIQMELFRNTGFPMG